MSTGSGPLGQPNEQDAVGDGPGVPSPDAPPPGDDTDRAFGDPSVTGFGALVARSREAIAVGQARAEELLERHDHRPVVATSLMLYTRDREMAGLVVSSALAFRLFLFMVPLIVLVVGIAGFLGGVVEEQDLEQAGLAGTLVTQVSSALSQPQSTRWLAIGVGLFGVVATGRSLSKVLVSASCLAWRMPLRARASVRVIGVIIGLLASIVLATLVIDRVRDDHGIAIAGISLAAVVTVYALGWLLVSLVLPRTTPDPGSVFPGTVLVTATLIALQAVSSLVVPDRLERASRVYGTVGIAVVALGWLFFASRAMVVSLALNAVVYERYGSISRLVFSLPGFRWLARRSDWIRRFFDLDA